MTDVRNDQWMLTEVVPFIDNNGGKIPLCLFKNFFRLSGDSDWTFRLKINGDKELKSFCENSNGELIWATDVKGEVTVSTKPSQFGRKQPSSAAAGATAAAIPLKVIFVNIIVCVLEKFMFFLFTFICVRFLSNRS